MIHVRTPSLATGTCLCRKVEYPGPSNVADRNVMEGPIGEVRYHALPETAVR